MLLVPCMGLPPLPGPLLPHLPAQHAQCRLSLTPPSNRSEALEHLEYPKRLRKLLLTPEREVAVELALLRDNGEVRGRGGGGVSSSRWMDGRDTPHVAFWGGLEAAGVGRGSEAGPALPRPALPADVAAAGPGAKGARRMRRCWGVFPASACSAACCYTG